LEASVPTASSSRRRLLAATALGAAGAAAFATTSFAGVTETPAGHGTESHGDGRRVKRRLAELGLTLPTVAAPAGAYVPAVRDGERIYSSGQLPTVDGNLLKVGVVGVGVGRVSQDDATKLAELAALNAIAAIGTVVNLDRIRRVVKVVGYIASAPDFYNQSAVLNGASDLLGKVWGDAGKHARSVVGALALPKNAPLEVEVVVSLG
jgi:enamine deaminase RidA (YjgF/YER057c/UK114 family)